MVVRMVSCKNASRHEAGSSTARHCWNNLCVFELFTQVATVSSFCACLRPECWWFNGCHC